MSIVGTWFSHVIDLKDAEVLSVLVIDRIIGDKFDGTYNGESISGTFAGNRIRFEVARFIYFGEVVGDGVVSPFISRRHRKGRPFGDGDDGVWTAEKTGGSGGLDDEIEEILTALIKRKTVTKENR